MTEEKQSFEDLHLKFGQVIQIHPNPGKSKDRFNCILVGCLPNEAVIITAPESGSFPVLKEGDAIAIRVMSANGVAIFPTLVLHIAEIPVYLVYLDFPKAIRFRMIRNASRVEVALPILVTNRDQHGIRGVAGRILDISLSGARIGFNQDIATKGDVLEIKGKFDVAGIRRTLSIQALARSKALLDNGHYEYGVEFREQDEEKLLVLFGYIFNAMAFGKTQKIE